MAGTLATSIFLNFQNKFKVRCTTLIIEAYYTSKSSNTISLNMEENDITAILHKYLDENPKRKKWKIFTNREDHQFNKTSIPVKGFAAKFSRIDLRFSKFWNDNEEYKYFVEAKNLKENDSDLKRRYITTGIDNFLAGGNYSNCEGFLVGYILEGSVDKCVDGINKLLIKDGRKNELIEKSQPFLSIDSHLSKHQKKEIDHLFLNYVN